MGYRLGVDVGTTYCAAAVAVNGHVETVALGNQAHAIPSAVYLLPEGGVLVGEAALRRGAGDPEGLAREFKRRFGDPTPLFVRGEPVTPEHLTGFVIRAATQRATELQGGAPADVVLTCPAAWRDYRRDLLTTAAAEAGIPQVTIVTEPEAAAAHYASLERVPLGAGVAVYDLGGGTFDATVLRRTPTGFTILGDPEGIDHLGGVDFDEAVFDHVVATLGLDLDDLDPEDVGAMRALSRLRSECTAAKEDLSEQAETVIPVALPGTSTTVTLTRAAFESMIRPLIGETLAALERALDSAGLPSEEVHSVLLVGGSSRIPLVAEQVSAAFGRPLAADTHPKYAVALGAVSKVEPVEAPSAKQAPSPDDGAAPAPTSMTADAPSAPARPARPRRDRRGGMVAAVRRWRPPRVRLPSVRLPWLRAGGRRVVLLGVAALAVVLVAVPVALRSGRAEAPDTMPVLQGMALGEARTSLAELGLLVSPTFAPTAQPENTVLSSTPGAGEPRPVDRVVDVVVSVGEDEGLMPALYELPVAEALTALDGLDVRAVVSFEPQPGAEGIVRDTEPAEGQPIWRGAEVILHVNTGEPQLVVPDVRGVPFGEAEERLRHAGFRPELVGVETAGQELGTVVGTEPSAGSSVPVEQRRVTVQAAVPMAVES